jgi:hypothetical protein
MAPVAAPFHVDVDAMVPPPSAAAFGPSPSQYPVVQRKRPSVDLTADVVRGENWFESTEAVGRLEEQLEGREETWVGTRRKRKSLLDIAKMLAVPAIVAASVGVAIGVYISYNKPLPAAPQSAPQAQLAPQQTPAPTPAKLPVADVTTPPPAIANAESANAATASSGGDQPEPPTKAEAAAPAQAAAELAKQHAGEAGAEPSLTQDAPASAQPAAPAAAVVAAKVETPEAPPAPANVQEIQTKTGVVKLVDVRIDSKPSGATVMLVDNGKTSFLGTTPLATSLDPAHGYDVVFTLEGRPTQMAHFEPSKSARLDVSLGHTHHTSAPVEAPAVAKAIEKAEPAAKVEKKEPAKIEKTAKAIEKAEPKAEPAKATKKAKSDAMGGDPFGGAGGEGTDGVEQAALRDLHRRQGDGPHDAAAVDCARRRPPQGDVQQRGRAHHEDGHGLDHRR